MDVEILKQKETPLLARTRLSAVVYFEGQTPSRINLRKSIASKIGADETLVIIRHIYQRFGNRNAKIIAHVYKDKKLMEKIEGEKLVKKHLPKAESGEEEKAKEEKTKEEKKEKPAGKNKEKEKPKKKE